MYRSKNVNRTRTIAAATAALLLALPGAVSASSDTSAKEVAAEVREAMKTIASYTADKRDMAAAQAKEALAALDGRITAIEDNLETRWDSMGAQARQRARLEMARLRVKRNELSEWYGGIKHNTGEAWKDVAQGFAESYTALSDAVAEARKEF